MHSRAFLPLALAAAASCSAPEEAAAPSLRGLSAGAAAVWATGSGGAVLRGDAGSASLLRLPAPPGAEELDFRDVEAMPGGALLMAAGPGAASGLWWMDDRGRHPLKLLDCPWAEGFFDGMAFWDERRGLLVGDPVEGALMILRTEDGGRSWKHLKDAARAHRVPEEFAFAASGTSVCVAGERLAWIATGGAGGGRVWRSEDAGETWSVAETPLARGRESAGAFSIVFADALRGAIVGGDYLSPDDRERCAAWSEDGGRTWTLADTPPGGYRSCVALLPGGSLVCTGPSGTDVSRDGGRNWEPLRAAGGSPLAGFHAAAPPYLAGGGGRIALLP